MSLVSDILDFSELENDTMELVEEPYNITSVINDVVNMAHVWNKEKNLEIIVDCEADIPNNLLGDSQKIYRIILNLIYRCRWCHFVCRRPQGIIRHQSYGKGERYRNRDERKKYRCTGKHIQSGRYDP